MTIPNSVTSVGKSAFGGCSGLTSVHISDLSAWCNIKFVDTESNPLIHAHHLFIEGNEVFNLTFPESVTSIGEYAFSGCSGLTSVTIPGSVTSIGYQAFRCCSGLTSVTIPNSVTSIGDGAFSDCSGLTSVTIGNSVTNIGDYAFYNCSGLTSVTIGNSVTSIGDYAFSSCSSLTSVTIPNSVTSIGDYAFYNCSGLTSVTIGNSVTNIGEYAFYGCSGLKKVIISDIAAWCGISFSFLFSNPLKIAHHLYNKNDTEITNLIIPDGVTSICNTAFIGCEGLTSVTIPNSVTFISASAFYQCSGLTSVTIGTGIRSISYHAFAGCPELVDVFCYAENVPYTESDAFLDSYIDYATLHVPGASVNLYNTTAPWSGFGTIVGTDGSVPITRKCATPTINYTNGKLSFSCETEDVEFVSEIKSTDINKFYSKDVSLTGKYTVTVYATKTGYDNSDTATREINMAGAGGSGVPGDVNGDGMVNAADIVTITNIIMGNLADGVY